MQSGAVVDIVLYLLNSWVSYEFYSTLNSGWTIVIKICDTLLVRSNLTAAKIIRFWMGLLWDLSATHENGIITFFWSWFLIICFYLRKNHVLSSCPAGVQICHRYFREETFLIMHFPNFAFGYFVFLSSKMVCKKALKNFSWLNISLKFNLTYYGEGLIKAIHLNLFWLE